MLSKTEKKIFTFIKELPRKFFIWFWAGIAFYTIKYIVAFLLPLQQKQYLDEALKLKYLWTNNFIILIILFTASIALLLIQYISFRTLRVNLGEYLYKLCLNRIIRLPKQSISTNGTGYYNSVITNLTQSLSTLVSPTIFDFFFSVIQMIAINIIIFHWNKSVFIVFCSGYILAAINTYFFHKLRKKYLDAYNTGNTEISAETNDIITNTFTIRSFNVINFLTRPLWKKIDNNKHQLNNFLKVLEINRFIFALIKTGAFAVMLIMVLNSIFQNKMTYGQLLALISYFESLFIPFHNYVTFLGDMINYGSWLDKFDHAFKEVKKETTDHQWLNEPIRSIGFDQVIIPYQKEKNPLNFNITTKTGIAGLSGEGKTSILQILYREILPEKGKVILNQTLPAESVPLFNYYNQLNILNQDLEIFNKNLEFNLTLGKKIISENEISGIIKDIEKSLKIITDHYIYSYEKIPELIKPLLLSYGIVNESGKIKHDQWQEFLKQNNSKTNKLIREIFDSNFLLQSEYESVVGNLEINKLDGRNFGEKGTFISGGEKQKIAFARFLLKKNYDFFILDEPFTSLDAINEKKLLSLLKDKIVDKPGIIISHKFHILEAVANDFIMIHDGIITNRGSVGQMVKNDPLFRKLREEYYHNLRDQIEKPVQI